MANTNNMTEKYDLHCHSTASDGALTPTEVVRRACEQGVTGLALTDHDSVAGLAEARQAANNSALRLIPGIELSAVWNGKTVHIIGLNIDPQSPILQQATHDLQNLRIERAQNIARKLEKKGIPGAFEAVSGRVGDGMITRSHFADFLVANFHVNDHQDAFDRYLGHGKPAYAATEWTPLEDALQWIDVAGGIAVVAHPLRYKLTASWMKRFLTAFKDGGGQAIEVVAGRYNADEIRLCAAYAKQFGLYGSVGSDFHSPENPWLELGRLAPLPDEIKPVWELFSRKPG
jgi:predicted metal-dependent phosphoesterase TrpH